MRNRSRVILIGGLAVLLSGCWTTPSLHPLYTEESKAYEPALLGTWHGTVEGWKKKTSAVSFTLEPWNADAPVDPGDGSYKVTYSGEDGSSWYRGVLTEIEDRLYLDILVDGDEWDKVFFDDVVLASPLLLLPTHGIYRFTLDGDALRVEQFLPNPEVWERIRNDELHLQHEIINPPDFDDFRLVTASTADLRSFIAKHGSEQGVFVEVATFSRQTPPAPKTEDGRLEIQNCAGKKGEMEMCHTGTSSDATGGSNRVASLPVPATLSIAGAVES